MTTQREKELLAYAAVCFDNCTNPFELIHLQKQNVSLDECGDLSMNIADIIKYWLDDSKLIKLMEKEFEETQHEP